jgi:hypothetical protein
MLDVLNADCGVRSAESGLLNAKGAKVRAKDAKINWFFASPPNRLAGKLSVLPLRSSR